MNIAEIQAMTRNALEQQKNAKEMKYLKLIEKTDEEIEFRARQGNFTAYIIVDDRDFKERLINHYQSKKFRVTHILNQVTINWETIQEVWLEIIYCEGHHHFEIESRKTFSEMGDKFLEFQKIEETDFVGVMLALQEIKDGHNSSNVKIFKYNRDKVVDFLKSAGYDITSSDIPEDNPMVFNIVIFKKK